MPSLCLYFQLHQPLRLTDYRPSLLGTDHSYFSSDDLDQNRQVFRKVTKKSYLPMLSLLLELLEEHSGFNFALSCSGVFLEQAQWYAPEVIDLLSKIAKTKKVEFLSETYHHSLASIYSADEFTKQVDLHKDLLAHLFKITPTVFRNTELIYSDDIANQVSALGFRGMLTEAVDRHLHGRPKTQLFRADLGKKQPNQLPLLLKHAQLSDDVAFRFSDRSWPHYPLHADTYVSWLSSYRRDEIINLFMDFETFGEHQWEDTGIFPFFAKVVGEFLEQRGNKFVTPAQIINRKLTNQRPELLPVYGVPQPISWADVDRDLTAWVDNELQKDTLNTLYSLEEKIKLKKNSKILEDWRRLQTSDHFYYMCTKWSADGDVHAYFNAYDSPYEGYRRFCMVLADLEERLMN